MDQLNQDARKLAAAFQKYRRLQKKRAKLYNAKANPKNVQPMKKVLGDINWLLNEMDGMAAKVIAGTKPGKEVSNGLVRETESVN